MKVVSICLFFTLGLAYATLGQCVIRGTVSEANGMTIPAANVYLQNNTSKGTNADFDGNYSLKIDCGTTVTVICSSLGLETAERQITVTEGESPMTVNFILSDKAIVIEGGAEVTFTMEDLDQSKEAVTDSLTARSAGSIDIMSGQVIKQLNVSRVDDVVEKMPGAAKVGGFVTVRGLADRYILTTFNDMRVPTLDPFTNNIKLDIFPTNLIDNLIIAKTATADKPAGWSGAFISVSTKDYPEELSVSVTSSFGYNAQTTFNDIVSTQGGDNEWLGWDGPTHG